MAEPGNISLMQRHFLKTHVCSCNALQTRKTVTYAKLPHNRTSFKYLKFRISHIPACLLESILSSGLVSLCFDKLHLSMKRKIIVLRSTMAMKKILFEGVGGSSVSSGRLTSLCLPNQTLVFTRKNTPLYQSSRLP